MKKVLILGAIVALGSTAAHADHFSLSIGEPAPTYVVQPQPQPYVVEQPGPAFIVGGEHHVYPYHDRRHHYDWNYWHHHR